MGRWHGCWLLGIWLLCPIAVWSQEPSRISLTTDATDISRANSPLKLTRPNGRPSPAPNASEAPTRSSGWTTTTSGLLCVLGLIVAGGFILRKTQGRLPGVLPDDAVQILGRRGLDSRNTLHVIRFGSKVILVANSPQQGLQTLSELTDPHEVEQLTQRCLSPHPASRTGPLISPDGPAAPFNLAEFTAGRALEPRTGKSTTATGVPRG